MTTTYLTSGYENILSRDNIQEMIIVIDKGYNTLGGSFYVNSSATGNWEDFIMYDLIRYVDSHYRTIRKKQCRGIAGYSMGGFGAFNMAMKFPDVFNSFYGASPALMIDNYLDEFFGLNDDDNIKECIDYLESLKADNLENELQILINTFQSQSINLQNIISIGAAFVPDASGHVPFLHFPYSLDENQQLIKNDSIMNFWVDALGNWKKKIELYDDNLLLYDTLIFNYGDEEDVIGRGVRNVYNLTRQHNVESSIIVHEGGHGQGDRFFTQMFPAMSTTLWRDSSRFRTETEILAFELDNQVRETIIDSEKGTVEAFVSDTTDIEAIIPHMILSDGAWETPIASQELDFSWGPISFRVTSGDGHYQKLWDVTVTQISTSSFDVDELEDLSIFPNPARNTLYINYTVPLEGLDMEIYNMMGSRIEFDPKISGNKIDIGNLPKGIYVLRITGKEVNYLGRFIKE